MLLGTRTSRASCPCKGGSALSRHAVIPLPVSGRLRPLPQLFKQFPPPPRHVCSLAARAEAVPPVKKTRGRKSLAATKPPLPSVMLLVVMLFTAEASTFCVTLVYYVQFDEWITVLQGSLNSMYCVMQPAANQQTLQKSFTVGGLGLHSGDYGERPRAIAVLSWPDYSYISADTCVLLRSLCSGASSTSWRRPILCARPKRCVI